MYCTLIFLKTFTEGTTLIKPFLCGLILGVAHIIRFAPNRPCYKSLKYKNQKDFSDEAIGLLYNLLQILKERLCCRMMQTSSSTAARQDVYCR